MNILYIYKDKYPGRDAFVSTIGGKLDIKQKKEITSKDIEKCPGVLFDDASLIPWLKEINSSNTPVFFVKSGLNGNILYPFPNLHKVITRDIKTKNLTGLPRKMFTILSPYMLVTAQETKRQNNKNTSILHIPDNHAYSYNVAVSLISIFNHFSDFKLTVAVKNNHHFFESIANDNITILHVEDKLIDWTDYHVFIGEGSMAVSAIYNMLPVIVSGCRGFGGLIIKENMGNFFKHGIQGRMGAEINESIPSKFILNELTNLNKMDINSIVTENRKAIDKFYQSTSVSEQFTELVREAQLIQKILYDASTFMQLKVELNEHIGLFNCDEQFALINNKTNKIIGSIDRQAASWLRSTNSTITIKDSLYEIKEANVTDYYDLVIELWNEKVITFTL